MSKKNRKRTSTKSSKDDDDVDHYYIPDKKDGRKLVEVKEKKVLDKYLNLTKPELQHYLRWNGQIVTGSKLELLLRCIDGEINGRIPKCNSCGQGQFVYDYTESKYICRGYFDHLAKTPIRCGHTEDNIEREDRWRDPNRGDSPFDKFAKENSSSKKLDSKEQGGDDTRHHSEHPEHHHHSHHCQVEENHPLVDLLEDMAYYHAVLKDDKWNYKARAFLQSARAVENLDFEVDVENVDELGKRGKEHVERIGPSSTEAMRDFLQNDKKFCSQLDGMRKSVKEKKDKGEISKEDEEKVGTSSSYAGPGQKLKRKSTKKSKTSTEE